MSGFERGPLLTFEVTWASGHIETVRAHQVLMPVSQIFGGDDGTARRIMFHGEIDGDWQLILAAPEADIHTVRNITAGESIR